MTFEEEFPSLTDEGTGLANYDVFNGAESDDKCPHGLPIPIGGYFHHHTIEEHCLDKQRLIAVAKKHRYCALVCENRYSENSTGSCVDNILEELGL